MNNIKVELRPCYRNRICWFPFMNSLYFGHGTLVLYYDKVLKIRLDSYLGGK